MMTGYYGYEQLRAAAVSKDATQSDINALGEWFAEHGSTYWNGEYYDAGDGMRIFPIYTEPNEYGDCEIVGYEFR